MNNTDAALAAANNPTGAVSHNLVDITGAGGPGFNLAPSLSSTLTLNLAAPVRQRHRGAPASGTALSDRELVP